MSVFSIIKTQENDLLISLQGFLRSVLESDKIDALMVPCHLPAQKMIMPTLITDPEVLDQADPLAPCFPLNAAKIASRLTKGMTMGTVVLVMRPCEIRAFSELIKLKQGSRSDILILGIDCLGAFENKDYNEYAGNKPLESTRLFYKHILDNNPEDLQGKKLSGACKICEHSIPDQADIAIGFFGMDYNTEFLAEAKTEKGEELFESLNISGCSEPENRKEVIRSHVAKRIRKRDKIFEKVSKTTSSPELLADYLTGCVNCYNCRVACPVCYCKECVFMTDVFQHQPFQYMQWAKRKGCIKLPTDTLFYHLTRMAHIGLSCVGCGQCSAACPNDIPLMELFRTIAHHSQEAFDYQAGRDPGEPLPLSVFEEDEYKDVVGIKP